MMIVQDTLEGQPVSANLTSRALTVAIGRDEVLSWDRHGRLYSEWHQGWTRRRGLNGKVLEKRRASSGLIRRRIEGAAADAVVDRAARRARAIADVIGRSRSRLSGLRELCAVLERAAVMDAAEARRDALRFSSIYGEIGVLPPDQYLALVVQATTGCSFGSCAFCELYTEPFRARTLLEFAGHVEAVRAYMGDSMSLRGRSVFLGAANALTLPTKRLVPLLDVIAAVFSRPPVGAFVDALSGSRKTSEDYRTLATRGLRRVYIGLESGHDPLLSLIGKPGRSADAIRAVEAVKAAKLGVGVIVMTGLGGRRFDRDHVRDTVATLNAMRLGAGDVVYFSNLVQPRHARHEGSAVAPSGCQAQRQRIQDGLVFAGSRPQVARYDVREFVY